MDYVIKSLENTYCSTVHCHYYCYCLYPVIYVTWFLDNLHRVGKLIKETVLVFWVDLGYRLRSRNTVPLQGSEGWLTSHLFTVPQCDCEFTVPQWCCVYCYCYCYWLPSGRAWFSARHLGRGPGYVRDPPKIRITVSNYQFQQ